MLLARAIRRAGSAEVNAVRRAAANHRYHSPQGPIWVDPDNNHCFLTPRLAHSEAGSQFRIFWEADAPVAARSLSRRTSTWPRLAQAGKRDGHATRSGPAICVS